jgi:hypothetical protein
MLQKSVTPLFSHEIPKKNPNLICQTLILLFSKYRTSYSRFGSNTVNNLRKYPNQIHKALEYLHVENLSQRRKRQEEARVCSENIQIVFLDKEKM